MMLFTCSPRPMPHGRSPGAYGHALRLTPTAVFEWDDRCNQRGLRIQQTACLALIASLGAMGAHAQSGSPSVGAKPSAAAASAKPAKATVTDTVADLVVSGQKAAITTSIDRKSYSVARDLQSAHGSVVDVLRNLPSVDVDVDGNVSLRGQGVQILVDGKPSAMFSGGQRATTLQQMPARAFESMEVMTNPSAEFSPDGSGGIINLVTKKPIRMGKSGSLRASIGSFGKWSTSANGAVTRGPMTISGNLDASFGSSRSSSESLGSRSDPILSQQQTNSSFGDSLSESRNGSGSLSVDYELTPRERLTASANLLRYESDSLSRSDSLRLDGAGAVIEDLQFSGPSQSVLTSTNASASWRRTWDTPGRLLTVNGSFGGYTSANVFRANYDYRSDSDRIDDRDYETRSKDSSLSLNYTLPLANKGLFKTGFDFRLAETDTEVVASSIDPVTGAVGPLPNLTNHFVYETTNHQVFATYQRPFGKLSVLGGMRLEAAAIDYDQRTTAIRGSEQYFDVHPSLHLQYELTEAQKINVGYSHRVRRPSGSQLNPFISYFDDYSASSGNPALRPQETHSFEGGWQWVAPKATIGTTLYYRQNYNTIGSVSRFLTPTLILTTSENQGTSTSSGLELTATGKVGARVSYNLSSNISHNVIQRSSLAGGGEQSAFAYTARSNFDLRLTDKDFVQTRLNYRGKQISAQGFSEASGTVDLGYQRKIRPNLMAVLVVNDIFRTARSVYVTDTPYIQSVSRNFSPTRTFSIGLTRQFGGRPLREGQIDYSAGGSGDGEGAGF